MRWNKQFFQQAFREVCGKAEAASPRYVSLYRKDSRYGGPEEGGWWIEDLELVETQRYDTDELAQAVAVRARERAKRLSSMA
jgi:hypothetical protein